MKNKLKTILFIMMIPVLGCLTSCGPATVGVGVHVPGPWVGPRSYPGGTITIGMPVGGGYYPYHDILPDKMWVDNEHVSRAPGSPLPR